MTGFENNCWNPNMKLNRAEATSVRISKPKANRNIYSVMILHDKTLKHEWHFSLQDSESWTPSRIVKSLGGLVRSPCITCGHRARENKDLWPSTRVHWAEQHVLKLTSAPNKGGQPKRQHNSHWSASTYWIVLKDSSSFKTDGTCSPSAVQPTAGFRPICRPTADE